MNWIIMPCRNSVHLTKAAIESCLAQDIPVNILCIDQGSTDNTVQYLDSLWPKVTTIHYSPPKPLAYVWNRALEFVFSQAEHALVVNNDVEIRPDTYRLLLGDGSAFVTAVGQQQKPLSTDAPRPDAKRPHPDFSCFLIRKSVFDTIGGFDEDFIGAYVEDQDYHLRMHRAGIHACCIDLPFFHYAAGTLKQASEEEAARIRSLADKNRLYFEQKWGFRGGSPEYYAAFGTSAPQP